MHAAGPRRDARQANLLDGGAPLYRTYACADGGHVAVGAIEPAFFAALLAGLRLDPAEIDQNDRSVWPSLASRFATRFAERSRDDWAEVFAGTDACVTPVLSLSEAPHHPHNRARATFAAPGGPMQPMPAPRFSATPAAILPTENTNSAAILKAWAR